MSDYQQAKLFEQRFEKSTRRFTSQSLALSYKVHDKLGQRGIAKNYGAMLVKMFPQSWEAKQYLLNELEMIEADNLAKRYQLSKVNNRQNQSKKRIVKLSPNKQPQKKNSTKVALDPKRENQPSLAAEGQKSIRSSTKKMSQEKQIKKEHSEQLDFHIVSAGDTLYAISMKYNIKIKALRRWNNINNKLQIKDKIFLKDPTLVNQ
jgi:type IV pilus assembly protein PilF